ncbi:MAG: YbdD/YjiX family protein [Mycobacteriaceae bacterium]|nr:YbdD/YjiX family protein [Mycobacteriaceae bacterium]
MRGPDRAGLRAAVWWFREVLRANDYRHYLDYMRRNHPDAPVMTERAYWRRRYADDPGVRCC